MLDAVAKTTKQAFSGYYYIGDMPDDMLAASRSRAGFKGIGLLLSALDKDSLKKELIEAGADYIIEDFEGLKPIIESE